MSEPNLNYLAYDVFTGDEEKKYKTSIRKHRKIPIYHLEKDCSSGGRSRNHSFADWSNRSTDVLRSASKLSRTYTKNQNHTSIHQSVDYISSTDIENRVSQVVYGITNFTWDCYARIIIQLMYIPFNLFSIFVTIGFLMSCERPIVGFNVLLTSSILEATYLLTVVILKLIHLGYAEFDSTCIGKFLIYVGEINMTSSLALLNQYTLYCTLLRIRDSVRYFYRSKLYASLAIFSVVQFTIISMMILAPITFFLKVGLVAGFVDSGNVSSQWQEVAFMVSFLVQFLIFTSQESSEFSINTILAIFFVDFCDSSLDDAEGFCHSILMQEFQKLGRLKSIMFILAGFENDDILVRSIREHN